MTRLLDSRLRLLVATLLLLPGPVLAQTSRPLTGADVLYSLTHPSPTVLPSTVLPAPPAPLAAGDVLSLLNLTTDQAAALRALTPADLAALKTLAAGGNTGASATLAAYVQVAHTPAGPLPTSSATPFGLTLKTPNSNVLDATFGTQAGSTITNMADLLKVFATRDLLGTLSDPSSTPGNGIPSNFATIYEDYPEGDPRSLHVFSADHLGLIFRKAMATDSNPTSPWKGGYIRPLIAFQKGMTLELTFEVPGAESDRGSWPTSPWLFTGEQLLGTQTVLQGTLSTEIDPGDNLQDDKARPGSMLHTGWVPYNYIPDPSGAKDASGNPVYINDPTPYAFSNVYITDGLDWTPRGPGWSNPASSFQIDFFPSATLDHTKHYVHYAVEWRANDTFVFSMEGKPIRITHLILPANYASSNDGSAVPANRTGKQLPLYIQISHQGYNESNPSDRSVLDARPVVRSEYKVAALRVWASETNAAPAPSPVAVAAPTLGGHALTWQNQGAAQVYQDPNDGSLVMRAASQTSGNPHALLTPMQGAGSYTMRLRSIMPNKDYYNGGLVVYNSAGGANLQLLGLYANPDRTYMRLNSSVTGGLPTGGVATKDYFGVDLGHDWCGRYVVTSTNITGLVSGDPACAAGTWQAMGTVLLSDAGGPFDQWGFYLDPNDGASTPSQAQVTASRMTYTSSTDPQAAGP